MRAGTWIDRQGHGGGGREQKNDPGDVRDRDEGNRTAEREASGETENHQRRASREQ